MTININLLNYDDKNTAIVIDTMFSYSDLLFINTLTRMVGHSKAICNIFYNKPMLNITAANISSVIRSYDPIFDLNIFI